MILLAGYKPHFFSNYKLTLIKASPGKFNIGARCCQFVFVAIEAFLRLGVLNIIGDIKAYSIKYQNGPMFQFNRNNAV